MKKHQFQIIIEKDEAGFYVAECPALRACYTQGKTYEELIENIKDVIAMYPLFELIRADQQNSQFGG